MVRSTLFAPAGAFITAACLATPVLAQEGQVIELVEIRGVKNTNAEIVRLAAAQAGLKEGQVFRQAAVADARRLISEKGYYSDSYIKAEVTPEKQVRVIVEVFENPKIAEVRIKGNRVLSSEKILPFLDSKPDTVINVATLRADVQKIQNIYRKQGYEAFVLELEGDDVFDPKTNILTFTISETVIESIEIQGLHKTKPFVVTREMRTKIGEPLNYTTLQRDNQRIYNTGLFANVARPQIEPTSEGRVKLVIPVEEQRTGQVQVGFGYSVRQRLTGTLEISEQNFRGRGQGVSASWTVGGTVARNQYELGFTEPWIDKNNTSLGINLYDRFNFRFNRVLTNNLTDGTNDNPYYEQRRGAVVTLSRPVSEFARAFTSLRTETVKANNFNPDYRQFTADEITSIRGALIQDGSVTSMTLRYLTNTRDNEQDPSTGFYFSPSFEFGRSNFNYQKPRVNPAYFNEEITPGVSPVLVNKIKQTGAFTKINIDTRRYINLGKPRVDIRDPRRVIATRVLLGTSTGNISFSEQYFMGGADSLRGYADDRFWGNHLFLASAELRLPLDKRGDFNWVLFTDIGDAWGASTINSEDIPGFEQHHNFSPRLGAGFGVRFRTPVGPVRLDLGFGETVRTHFSIGPTF